MLTGVLFTCGCTIFAGEVVKVARRFDWLIEIEEKNVFGINVDETDNRQETWYIIRVSDR